MVIPSFLVFLWTICDLVLASEVNRTENVTAHLSYFDGRLRNVFWCEDGNKQENLMVLSDKGSVYRSSNAGVSWTRLSSSYKDEEFPILPGPISVMYRSPVNGSIVVFIAENIPFIAATNDCGVSVQGASLRCQVRDVKFHSIEKEWLLISISSSNCDEQSGAPCEESRDLYVTRDLGRSWSQIAQRIVQFSWAWSASYLPSTPVERILLSFVPSPEDSQITSKPSEEVSLYLTDDFGRSFNKLAPRVKQFFINRYYFFAVQINEEDAGSATLLVSSSRNDDYTFEVTELPHRKLREGRYTLLDAENGQAFLYMDHSSKSAPFGNIYSSDARGERFTLALRNNIRSGEGQSDFVRVLSLEAILIANVLDDAAVSEIQQEKDVTSLLERNRRTVISFDNGGEWRPLRPPSLDATGRAINCSIDECSLHLHSHSSRQAFSSIYSRGSSLGLVMGTGNIGSFLSKRADQVNTYLSRDGGLNWFEVAHGSHVFEFGDHGGIVVMVDDQAVTTTLRYSWNEGLTWESFEFAKEPIEVEDIVTEPTSTGERFILHGVSSNGSGVAILLDFSTLHQRTCMKVNHIGDPLSDYELWAPRGRGECLLGHRITYIRRKRDAECFNPEEWDRPQMIDHCQCKEEDWECDSDFVRKAEGGPCVRADGKQMDYSPPNDCEGGYYASRGYRRIAGDTCWGGIDHSSIRLPCPTLKILKTVDTVSVVAIGIGIIALTSLVLARSMKAEAGYKPVETDEHQVNSTPQDEASASVQLGFSDE